LAVWNPVPGKTMGVREVTRNTSEIFERTSNGDTVIVTNRGRVVGIITPLRHTPRNWPS
jgi:antitoxin (DNA-binding transcriptional repressor) of toxin-antitoxin stability system